MIADYIFYDADGFIKLSQSCSQTEAEYIEKKTGLSAKKHQFVDPFGHIVKDGSVIPVGAANAETLLKKWEPSASSLEEDIRIKRDMLLSVCDWTQLPDAPVANMEAWQIYRQALRDVTSQPDPFNITWPVAPV